MRRFALARYALKQPWASQNAVLGRVAVRSTKDALRKVWKEIQGGREWIVDADAKDFFGSVDHEKPLTLVAQNGWRTAGCLA
jgi:hypothetical protein